MKTGVLVVGAGPIGLEVAFELKRRGIAYLHVDKGQIASTIAWFPREATFFSSTDRIAIAGVPLQTPGQRKATREEYLAYLRTVATALELEVSAYEEVVAIEPQEGGGFHVRTRGRDGGREIRARHVVLATGDMARPRRIGVPGEDLPHVSHYFDEPHRYFRQRLLVIGGRNSAVEAALRCWHAGARVTLSYRGTEFDAKAVKYWLLPELTGRIRRGEITCHMGSMPLEITPDHVSLQHADGRLRGVPADFVLLLTGYVADMSLFEQAGAELVGEARAPRVVEETMETTVPGLFAAGTAVAGTQRGFRLFIENCHIHAQRIAAAIAGEPPPPAPPPLAVPES